MQTLLRHNQVLVAEDQRQAPASVDFDTTPAATYLQRLCNAERQIVAALDAARESIARCEHALALIAEARVIAPNGHIRSQPSRLDDPLTAPAHRDGLTAREVEVLRHVASGQSNRHIAEALYLSPRTVERHIANIYLKIDAHSKAEATAYAQRHRLA